MPDDTLLAAYLGRLAESLPLPESERRATIEEIASHVSMTADALVQEGLPRDLAERRAIARLGAPERLAADIAASHRAPGNLLAAAGTALRISLVTTTKALILGWTGILFAALVVGVGVAVVRKVAGPGFLQLDWSPVLDPLFPAIVGAMAAFGVGRALVGPVAIAARRPHRDVRMPLLVAGVAVTLVVGLTAVEARWTVATAGLMATMPAWFALGVVRPNLLPTRRITGTTLAGMILLVLVGSVTLVVLAGGGSQAVSSVESRAWDPNVEYANVGPFVSIEQPPITLDEQGTSMASLHGAGPVTVRRTGSVGEDFATTWTDVRLEVWAGPVGELNGRVLDVNATEPLAVAAMSVSGRDVSGHLEFMPLTDRHFYYVAVTGTDADGQRWQLAWPGVESWEWRGTPLELFLSTWR